MQNGELTKEDVEFINTKVVGNKSIHLPKDIRDATYFNRDRDVINTALFEEHCARLRCHSVSTRDTLLIILANELAAKTSHGNYEPFRNQKLFWENCGEDDIKFPREHNGRMDPLLKLYKGCQLMLVFSNNVRHGEANGATVTLISICLKPNIVPIQIITGKLSVKAIHASQVVSIVLKHNTPKIILLPNMFQLEPTEFCITARILKPKPFQIKEDDHKMVKMKPTQFPVISNQGTTRHNSKLLI